MISQSELMHFVSYDSDTGEFLWKNPGSTKMKPGQKAGFLDAYGYWNLSLEGKKYKAHRMAWLYVFGVHAGDTIDHINGKPSDNRICNLREATRLQNQKNQKMHSNNKLGLKGVSRAACKTLPFRATIKADGKAIHLGCFSSPEEAHAAYKSAATRLHGSFARAA